MISFASAPTSLNHIKMHYITDHGAIINVSYSFIWPFAFAEKAGLRLGFLYRLRCWANSVLLHEFAPKGLAMPFYHDHRTGVKRWGYCQQLVLTSCTGTSWIKGCNAELHYLGSFSFSLENHPTYCLYHRGVLRLARVRERTVGLFSSLRSTRRIPAIPNQVIK